MRQSGELPMHNQYAQRRQETPNNEEEIRTKCDSDQEDLSFAILSSMNMTEELQNYAWGYQAVEVFKSERSILEKF